MGENVYRVNIDTILDEAFFKGHREMEQRNRLVVSGL